MIRKHTLQKRSFTLGMILTLSIMSNGAPIPSIPSSLNIVYAANEEVYGVYVEENYLALRTEMKYDVKNEIGELHNKDTVTIITRETGNKDYWYVYAPSLEKEGYVNCNFLKEIYAVKVETGYLALRKEMAYKESNEIGELHTKETVTVIDKETGKDDYWYVYAPSLEKEGYVNCKYLERTNEASASEVKSDQTDVTGYYYCSNTNTYLQLEEYTATGPYQYILRFSKTAGTRPGGTAVVEYYLSNDSGGEYNVYSDSNGVVKHRGTATIANNKIVTASGKGQTTFDKCE